MTGRAELMKALAEQMPWYISAAVRFQVAVAHQLGMPVTDVHALVNEAFAPVPLAWLAETGADPRRLNVLGGAIALGHPLGASGTSLMTRLIHHLTSSGCRYGLQTMCEGGGTANATLVELVA